MFNELMNYFREIIWYQAENSCRYEVDGLYYSNSRHEITIAITVVAVAAVGACLPGRA
jgi:hypothetical protein